MRLIHDRLKVTPARPDFSGQILSDRPRTQTLGLTDNGPNSENVIGKLNQQMRVHGTDRDCQNAVPLLVKKACNALAGNRPSFRRQYDR